MLKQLGLLYFLILITACSESSTSNSVGSSFSGDQPEGFTLASADKADVFTGDDLEEFSLIRGESFGGLKLDMSIQEFEPLLPCLVEKGEPILWAGIGEIIQEWNYQDCGVKLQLSTVDPETPQVISSIIVRAPSQLTTFRNIRIGSSQEEVMAAYVDYLDEDNSVLGDTLVVGSIYGGLIFTLKDNHVESMFLGAGAE